MPDLPRTCEANLLFESAIDIDTIALEDDIALVCSAYGLSAIEVPTDMPAFRLFDLGEIQMLVAGCADPLDVGHFTDAARPRDNLITDGEILARLTAHRFSLTVLISDADDDAKADPKRQFLKDRICWQMTEGLRKRFTAPLVFWCANDTLYASEEFAQTGPFDIKALCEPLEDVHRLNRQQMMAAEALSQMQSRGNAPGPVLSTSRKLSRSLKAMAMEPLDIARRYSQRLFRSDPSKTA